MNKFILLFTALIMIGTTIGFCEDASRKAEEAVATDPVRTAKGIQFKVPEDWPIEERNGAIGPVPVEEYLQLKFKKIDERISALEAQLKPKEKSPLPVKKEIQFRSYEDKQSSLKGEENVPEKVS